MQETADPESQIDAEGAPDAIRLVSATLLEGPNAWSSQPVVRLFIDAGSASQEGTTRLRSQMAAAGLSLDDGPAGGGAWTDIGKFVEAIAFEMQVFAGDDVTFSASRPAREPDCFDVVLGFQEPEMPVATTLLAIQMLNAMLLAEDAAFDFEREFDQQILKLVRDRTMRPQEEGIAAAALRRGIPFRFVVPGGTLIELGTGRYLRRYRGMMSSHSAYLGNSISGNKTLTLQILREIGLPVPNGFVVSSVDEAVAAADQLGYPVVLKPLNSMQGRGVGVDLRTEEKVREFFPIAAGATRGKLVRVENFIPGDEHRILVIDGKIAAVAQRRPAHVTGDGVRTVKELIEMTNADPLRGRHHEKILTRIRIDAATLDALERVGMTPESIPAEGQHVAVKLVSNLSQGGTSHDLTDEIDPENARLAILAAKAIDIAICGVDLVTPDISRPVWEVGGAFLELNPEPGSKIHSHPQRGKPRDIGTAVVDSLFPQNQPVRVPVVAVSGSRDAEFVCELVAAVMREAGRAVGLTTTDGSSIDGAAMDRPDLAGKPHAQLVLRNPFVDFAVLQVDPDEIDERGLSFEQCDVLVVTSVDERELRGPRSVETVLSGAIADRGSMVLDIADLATDDLLRRTTAQAMLFSADSDHAAIPGYLADGMPVVVASQEGISLLSGELHLPLMPAESLRQATSGHTIESRLAAIATAVALDVPGETIRTAFESM